MNEIEHDFCNWTILQFGDAEEFQSRDTAIRNLNKNKFRATVETTGFQRYLRRTNFFKNNGVSVASQMMCYDPDIEFDSIIPARHLLLHQDRFPEALKNKCKTEKGRTEVREEVGSKIRKSINKARSNYRYAVPQYFRDKGNKDGDGELQLLLPLELGTDRVAVAIRLDVADDGVTLVYQVKTLLTMDMACNNARLLQKLDQDWLLEFVSDEVEEETKTSTKQTQIESYMPVTRPYISEHQVTNNGAEKQIPSEEDVVSYFVGIVRNKPGCQISVLTLQFKSHFGVSVQDALKGKILDFIQRHNDVFTLRNTTEPFPTVWLNESDAFTPVVPNVGRGNYIGRGRGYRGRGRGFFN